ncbi:cleft lip and palate transmembrane protein 1-domain-containing protein [Geranomyces variabilis]|nr:cleft lip and palate transmembrane protein 1-domain-containing protein [Geranomyces variabilis]KAJ3136284.1 hypothetical protein HDU90_003335 [Geranomyces variabilis]
MPPRTQAGVSKKAAGAPATAAAAAATQGAPAQQRQPPAELDTWQVLLSIARVIVIYYLFKTVSRYFFDSRLPNAPSGGASPAVHQPGKPSATGVPTSLLPIWNFGLKADLKAFISESDHLTGDEYPVWEESGIAFGDGVERRKELVIDVPTTVQNNGSLWAHVFLVPRRSESPADGENDDGQNEAMLMQPLYTRKLLTRYMPKKRIVAKKNLVSAASSAEAATNSSSVDSFTEGEAEEDTTPIVSYWWPNVTLNIIESVDVIPPRAHPLMTKNVRIAEDGYHYYPVFLVNDFWMLQENLMPINETVKTLNISLSYTPLPRWKYQMYQTFEENFRVQNSVMGVGSGETDEIKRLFLDTNPILLAITVIVSTLHSVFDFLAFKNDVQFWRNKKSMEGLSFRAIIANVIQQAIIFLYLLDNDTSWMILGSSGVGLLIEAWKINKTVIVKRKPEFPFVAFEDRVKPSKLVSETRKHDEMAFKYVSWAMYPCLAGYAVYSLIWEEHKSWYSYVVGTLVGFVYGFGFISMTPQLFINYKMKSVAHMPWKTFMYKALNTFVDDLFAFVIKMPWLHRIACLRDDVVFLVYLYQKWIYGVDKRRRNEYGQIGEEDGEQEEKEEMENEDVVKSVADVGGVVVDETSTKVGQGDSEKDVSVSLGKAHKRKQVR